MKKGEMVMKLKEKEIKQTQSKNAEHKKENVLLKKIEKRVSSVKKYKKVMLISIVVVLCIIIALGFLFSKSGEVTTISESSLKEIIEISELSTVEYTYNSIVTVSNEKEQKYHVAYKGIVKAGFDFNELAISDEKENKKVIITVPKIKINSVKIDEESLDFIFIKEKYNTETTYQEAYAKCVDDLIVKAEKNTQLKEMAKENAVTTIKALIKPWEEQLPEGYTIEYR